MPLLIEDDDREPTGPRRTTAPRWRARGARYLLGRWPSSAPGVRRLVVDDLGSWPGDCAPDVFAEVDDWYQEFADDADSAGDEAGYTGVAGEEGEPGYESDAAPWEPRARHAAPRRSGRQPGRGSGFRSRGYIGLLVAAASAVGLAVSLPSLLGTAGRPYLGVVSTSELTSLNFAAPGRVAVIKVRLGQAVRRGQVLATTTAATAEARAVRAARAAVRADKGNVAALSTGAASAAGLGAAEAQLAVDRAHRAADWRRLLRTEIVAPCRGTVAAIDGTPGETVTPAGVPGAMAGDGAAQARPMPPRPLTPAVVSLRADGGPLPMLALRTPGGWRVRLFIPEAAAAAARVGQPVTVSVPAMRLTGAAGRIIELAQGPADAPGGAAHDEVLVQLPGSASVMPLNGMAADVEW